MSDFSSFTGKFRIQKEQPADSIKGTRLRQARESLACVQCRRAKLRCDRQRPCSSCSRRDSAAVCSFQPTIPVTNDEYSAKDRLAHLESLVKGLMHGESREGPNSPVNDACADPRVPDQNPIESLGNAAYVGSTHWCAILDDIEELKVALGRHEESLGPRVGATPAKSARSESIIFGCAESFPLPVIIAECLPTKREVDRMLAVFFRGESFIVPFVHIGQFQRQYRAFWADPVSVNPLWLSMLFSICSVSTLIASHVSPSQASRDDTISDMEKFHRAAGQCLVAGEYHRPQPFVLEALAMYAQGRNMQSLDPSREAGTIFSMIVRMAFEMGYHRDPDYLGTFTPFEGEMRRRFWALLKQVDLMISFQLGLPSNICFENCDTRRPRNLTDADFDVDTKVLPESRPEEEPINLLWFIVKDRQMDSFTKVCKEALSFHEKSEADILQLDTEIRHMQTTIPAVLRARPMSDSFADPPFLIMVRIYVEFIYLKSLCVLHRRYMARGRVFSTQSCVEAGQRLVSQFIEVYREFGPGGQLHQERWMLTNFSMNDFLMGVMVLCQIVTTWRRKGRLSAIDASTEDATLPLLRQAHAICVEKSPASRDARYVARAVKIILDRPSGPVGDEQFLAPLEEDEQGDRLASLGWLDNFQPIENGADWNFLDSLVLDQAPV